MNFQHHEQVWRDFPALVAGALLVSGGPADDRAAKLVDQYLAVARSRLAGGQSGLSAVGAGTTTALIVTEALHDTAAADVREVTAALAGALDAASVAILTRTAPRFTI